MTREDLVEVLADPVGTDTRIDLISKQPAVTVRENDLIIGVGGVSWHWEGFGEAWVLLSQKSQDCKLTTYRAIKMLYASLIKDTDYQRIQSVVRTDWPLANRMVKKMGFVREGRLKHYCPDGADVYMYAMTRDKL